MIDIRISIDVKNHAEVAKRHAGPFAAFAPADLIEAKIKERIGKALADNLGNLLREHGVEADVRVE